jgi:hypothetical protein
VETITEYTALGSFAIAADLTESKEEATYSNALEIEFCALVFVEGLSIDATVSIKLKAAYEDKTNLSPDCVCISECKTTPGSENAPFVP